MPTFKVYFERFPEDGSKEELTSLTEHVAELAKMASGWKERRAHWFGLEANGLALTNAIKKMSDYLNTRCTRITYVKKDVGQRVDCAPVAATDYGQVIPTVRTAYLRDKEQQFFVPSGVRVFALPEYFAADRYEKINYVYHEISHKVLDTVDYAYGPDKCHQLALTDPKKAIKNADNYGYFIADMDKAYIPAPPPLPVF